MLCLPFQYVFLSLLGISAFCTRGSHHFDLGYVLTFWLSVAVFVVMIPVGITTTKNPLPASIGLISYHEFFLIFFLIYPAPEVCMYGSAE